jgi:predicted phosphodiesterase
MDIHPRPVSDKSLSSSLRVAVVSDIHAYDEPDEPGGEPPSSLCTKAPEDQPNYHPITGLSNLIEQNKLQADVLVCCGDMGDKARPAGIKYVWDNLQKLKDKLAAELLAATAGNHDVDSRYKYNDYDAKGVLQSLLPQFPLGDETQNNKYWSRNYVVITTSKFRLVILNSSAYHGAKEEEFKHGRVSLRTVETLKAELADLERTHSRQVNILLCHHHPHKHGDIEDDDYSIMEGGHKLLGMLESGNYGNWIIIHGHKHHPRICYAAGGSSAPIVFSAGSLCARLYQPLQSVARNQFYLITFPLAELETLGLGLAGTFQSWDWIDGRGWMRAGDRSGLPPYGGFGNRGNVFTLANQVAALFSNRGEPYIKWDEVLSAIPSLKYLLPSDMIQMLNKLESAHTLRVLWDSTGQPAQIGK